MATATATKPSMVLETITPAKAGEYLKANKNFRRMDEKRARQLASDIEDDNWQVNGEAIKFNCDGSLRDGQHRLRACVLAGKPIQSWVYRGLQDDSTLDRHKNRSLSDYLRAQDEKNTLILAGTLQHIWRHDTKQWHAAGLSVAGTTPALLETLKNHPEVRNSVNAVVAVTGKDVVVPPTMLAAVHYIGSRTHPAQADAFMADVLSGANLSEVNAVFHLRRKFLANKGARHKMTRPEMLALIIKAWRFARDDASCESLKWQFQGQKAEAFPSIDD